MAFGDIVQAAVNDNDGSDPITVTLGVAPTIGNLLVLTCYNFDGAGAPGGTLLEAVERVSALNGDAIGLYYRVVQSGDSTGPWTVDLAAADQWAAILREYEGPCEASPLDQTGSSERDSGSTTLAVTAGGATVQADELVVAAWGLRAEGAGADTAAVDSVDNSFTDLLNEHNSLGQAWHLLVATAKKVLTGTGTPTVTATAGSLAFEATAVLATFKKSAAGGNVAIPIPLGACAFAGLAPTRTVFDPLANDARIVIRQA